MGNISITAARCVAFKIETPIVFLFFVYYPSDSNCVDQWERSASPSMGHSNWSTVYTAIRRTWVTAAGSSIAFIFAAKPLQ